MPNTVRDRAPIHVAVGVVENAAGHILIAQRPSHLHQGGLWEFPGGKVERGETVEVALQRELKEELGITATAWSPLIKVEHDYSDRCVILDVWRVTRFDGQPHGREGQPWRWVAPGKLSAFSFPAANDPIVRAVVAQSALADQLN